MDDHQTTEAVVGRGGKVVLPTDKDLKAKRYHYPDNPFPRHERAFLAILALIRNKVDWQTKILNPEIVARWKQELSALAAAESDEPAQTGGDRNDEDNKADEDVNQDERDKDNVDYPDREERSDLPRQETTRQLIKRFFSEPLWDLAISHSLLELPDCRNFDFGTKVVPSGVIRTYHADGHVTAAALANLKNLAALLEDRPDHKKDWHPGSPEVLDLIHPSLFCYVANVTPTLAVGKASASPADWLATTGSGTVAPDVPPAKEKSPSPFAGEQISFDNYQWLPTEFDVSESGAVRPMSYINNLHPMRNAAGYNAISAILAKFIPLFERVATDLVSGPCKSLFKDYRCYRVDKFEDSDWGSDSETESNDGLGDWDVETEGPFEPSKMHPTVPPVDSPLYGDPRDHIINLKGSRLQVIVKLASIHLTPENPEYKGGSWHTEATQREGIVATGIYYYDVENITTSRLSFRTAFEPSDIECGQDARRGVEEVFGICDNTPAVQDIGSIEAVEGRCIAFPNIYQHRVQPFSLHDRSKPGHRKILCFFLVDPAVSRLSTMNVPPQCEEWWVDFMAGSGGRGLPAEIISKIGEDLSLMTLEQAKAHRLDLMAARSAKTADDLDYFCEQVSLCEH